MDASENIARCACGRYSVGMCLDCSRPLCTAHGRGDDAFLCPDCVGRRSHAARTVAPGPGLSSVRAEIASQRAELEVQRQASQWVAEEALRQLDEQTAQAVSDFLSAVTAREPDSIKVGIRWVQPPRKLLPTGGHWEERRLAAYEICQREMGNEDSRDSRSVCILRTGHVQLYQHTARDISVAACNRDLLPEFHVGCEELQSRAYIWSRTSQLPGQLPFHLEWGAAPYPGVLHPGSVRHAEETITWFVKALAAYLERR
jgi:hypothetical protein